MQSTATSVDAYLAQLAPDRREALAAVRAAIKKGLDPGYQETMQYGMIGYSVPHTIYPSGYHCDPKQPLPMAGLASQKSHMSLYLMGLYVGSDGTRETELSAWFRRAWTNAGKKLDMGKACVRFKRLEDVPLEVVTEVFKRVTVKKYIEVYEGALATMGRGKSAKPAKPAAKAAKKVAKKAAKKVASKASGAVAKKAAKKVSKKARG